MDFALVSYTAYAYVDILGQAYSNYTTHSHLVLNYNVHNCVAQCIWWPSACPSGL